MTYSGQTPIYFNQIFLRQILLARSDQENVLSWHIEIMRKKLYHILVVTPYILTPWCRALLEKLTGLQLVKKFPAFHGTRRFITALTSVRHLSLSWTSPIQSIYPHLTSCRSVLILSTHLRLGLPSDYFIINCVKYFFVVHQRIIYLLTYLLTYLLHGAESFLKS